MAGNVVVSAGPLGGSGGRRGEGFRKVRLASWNIGSLTGKSVELVKSLHRRMINIACVQETKWVGAKAGEVDGYKLWYSGYLKVRNRVGILVEKELVDAVVEVRWKSDRIMTIKVSVGSVVINVVSVYAPQIGLPDDIKRLFGRSWIWSFRRYLVARIFSSDETLMAILVLTQAGMIRSTGVSVLGR